MTQLEYIRQHPWDFFAVVMISFALIVGIVVLAESVVELDRRLTLVEEKLK